MVKKFTIPFASQGDANDIPDALQVDGKVSFTQGFSYDYERPYDDPQAKDIAREDMNGLFKAITSAVGELQTLGASEWSNAIAYPKGAIVYFEKDLYISQVDDNQNEPPQSWTSIKNIADDSLKKAMNLSDLTDKATARTNLGLGNSATLNKTDVLGTSSNLVATQKLVNNTKINLENSKQDKLTFSGTGNVARMSEVDKKSNKNDVLKDALSVRFGTYGADPDTMLSGDYGLTTIKGKGFKWLTTRKIYNGDSLVQVGLPYAKNNRIVVRSSTMDGEWGEWGEMMITSDISQSTGYSTTSAMSQKAVTDRLNSIESSHGLGYGQSWVDVTSQRVAGTTYTNNTGKPIFLSLHTSTYDNTFDALTILVDSLDVYRFVLNEGYNNGVTAQAIIPVNSDYMVVGKYKKWMELR